MDGAGLGRRKGAVVARNQEVDEQEENWGSENKKEERWGGYVHGTGAGNKLVCCTQRRRGQMEFSSDRASEYLSPQAAWLAEDQRHKVML